MQANALLVDAQANALLVDALCILTQLRKPALGTRKRPCG
jgi:hypothetical protein